MIDETWNDGFKTATLKFYPELEGCRLQIFELEKIIEGKNATIIIQSDEIETLKADKKQLELKLKNRNIIIAVAIPVSIGIGITAGVLIVNAVNK